MEIVYTGEDMPESFTKSMFLAGPSLRPGQEEDMESWRKDALKILSDKGYDGVVFVPENRSGKFEKDFSYDNQIDWEDKYLNLADCIVFYVPRDISTDKKGNLKLPAFTTNVEFGAWASSGKIVFGNPKGSDKNNYLQFYADKFKVPSADTLTETLDNAMEMLGEGSKRSGGERYVPLLVWNTDAFQSWYDAQVLAGNELVDARLLYTFRPGYKKFLFLSILRVNMYVTSEKRNKTNEFVLSRPDISSVVMWYKDGDTIEVVLVKEFRSPAATEDGFIRELPGGSADATPEETAAEEIHEETGFYLDPSRLHAVSARQLAGTLSSHKSHLYSAELDKEEVEWFKSQDGVVHGIEEDTERTFVEVYTVSQLINEDIVDWSTLGMIVSVVGKYRL